MYCLLLHLLSSKKHTYKVSYEIKCGNWKTDITKRYKKKRPVFVMNLKMKVKIVINSFPEKFSIMYMIVKKVNNIITFFFSFFICIFGIHITWFLNATLIMLTIFSYFIHVYAYWVLHNFSFIYSWSIKFSVGNFNFR